MRPLLIGMNNPLSQDSGYALWPDPPGCTGHRIWKMLPMTQDEYLEAYERCNLVEGLEWSTARARSAAGHMLARMHGRRSIVFGAAVRDVLGLKSLAPATWNRLGLGEASQVALLPHPSGRNLWYNVPRNRAKASRILLEALK